MLLARFALCAWLAWPMLGLKAARSVLAGTNWTLLLYRAWLVLGLNAAHARLVGPYLHD